MIFPQLTSSLALDDNIYATQTDRTADATLRFTPEVRAQSLWARHAASAHALVTINRYIANPSESTTDAAIGAAGRYDLDRADWVAGRLDLAQRTEPRGNFFDPGAIDEPVRVRSALAEVSGSRTTGRARLQGILRLLQTDYADGRLQSGAEFDQDYRDGARGDVTLRGEYAVSPATAVFGNLNLNTRSFDAADAAGRIRSSTGAEALIGARLQPSPLTRLEAAIGYLRQDYEDEALGDLSGFSAQLRAAWHPTGLTSVTASVSRSIEDSPDVGVSGYLSTSAEVGVDHELRRHIILGARARLRQDRYRGQDRDDRRAGLSLRADYYLSRSVALGGTFDHDTRSSSGARSGRNYSDNRLAISLTYKR